MAAVASAKSVYNQLMEEICGGTKPYLGEGHLEAEHLRIRDKAIYQVRLDFSNSLLYYNIFFFSVFCSIKHKLFFCVFWITL